MTEAVFLLLLIIAFIAMVALYLRTDRRAFWLEAELAKARREATFQRGQAQLARADALAAHTQLAKYVIDEATHFAGVPREEPAPPIPPVSDAGVTAATPIWDSVASTAANREDPE